VNILFDLLGLRRKQDVIERYTTLNSTTIESTRYELSTSRLFIRFCNGTEYAYLRVSPRAYNSFLNADSPDQHFEAYIKYRFHSIRVA
jgi:hypothetical protein